MLQYLLIGLVIGGIYALAATGLVVTYVSSGILNFAFASIAFFIARTYYYLETQHGWPIWGAAVVSILLIAPALGIFLWFSFFRFLQQSTTLVKVVATIGLSVMIPYIADLLYGNLEITLAPGLAPEPVAYFKVFGVAITLDQVIVAACVVIILGIGVVILRATLLGLRVRAMVDSPALTSTSGISPQALAICVWGVATFVCGLIGVLIAPIVGLSSDSYGLLMAASFTAVLIGRFVRLGRTIVVAILLGIASAVLQYWLPPTSPISGGIINGLPFAFLFAFLIYEMLRRRRVAEGLVTGGSLDRAIMPPGGVYATHRKTPASEETEPDVSQRTVMNRRTAMGLFFVLVVAILPLLLSTFWVGLVASGIAFAVIFLSFTLVVGEGGMIWLCQAAFAGIGAVMTAYLVSTGHFDVVPAIIVAALIVLPGGLVIGFLTTRLGDLYVVLVTLAFGILMDRLVFSLQVFVGDSTLGITVMRPGFASSNVAFAYLVLVAFCLVALLVEHLRRSSAGMGLTAVRWSEAGARSIGLSVVQMKVLVAGVASFTAALGGGLVAVSYEAANPASFNTIGGLVWLSVIVTVGVRSNIAALYGGLMFTVVAGVFQTYLPLRIAQVPFILFGLGAVLVARNPDGIVAVHGRQVRFLLARVGRRWHGILRDTGGVAGARPPVGCGGAEEPGAADSAVAQSQVASARALRNIPETEQS